MSSRRANTENLLGDVHSVFGASDLHHDANDSDTDVAEEVEPATRDSQREGYIGKPKVKFRKAIGQKLAEDLRTAVLDQDVRHVKKLIAQLADPSTREKEGDKEGCPLIYAAAKRGHLEVVKALCDGGARLDETEEIAGTNWRGSVAYATVQPNGSLEMLRYLVEKRANINEPCRGAEDGDPSGGNLIWQACYFGQSDALRYLMRHGPSIHVKGGEHGDTPLHMAAKIGLQQAVRELLEAKADINARNSNTLWSAKWDVKDQVRSGQTPLDRALESRHVYIVKLLVSHHADLLQNRASLKLLFYENNRRMITAAAEGLMEAPLIVEKHLSKQMFLRFLCAKGDAPCMIMQAVFKPLSTSLKYFTDELPSDDSSLDFNQLYSKEDIQQKEIRTAYLPKPVALPNGQTANHVNVSEGPPAAKVSDEFQSRRTIEKAGLGDFIRRLVPQEPQHRTDVFDNVAFGHMLLPDIHNDLSVLVALSECSRTARHSVFKTPGLEAIVAHHWCKARYYTYFTIAWQVFILANFLLLTYALRVTDDHEDPANDPDNIWEQYEVGNSWIYAVGILAAGIVNLILQLFHVLGYTMSGFFRHYISQGCNWLDMVRNVLTFAIAAAILRTGGSWYGYVEFRVSLAFLAFLFWTELLSVVQGLEGFGVSMSPILEASQLIVRNGFVTVLLFILCGFGHAYYCLDADIQRTLISAMTQTWSVGVMKTLNTGYWSTEMKDLKGIKDQYAYDSANSDNETSVYQEIEVRTSATNLVVVFVVALTSVVTIVLLTVFIVVLEFRYKEACRRIWSSFIKVRTSIVTDYCAMQIGMRSVQHARTFEKKVVYTLHEHRDKPLMKYLHELREEWDLPQDDFDNRLAVQDNQMNEIDLEIFKRDKNETIDFKEKKNREEAFLFPLKICLRARSWGVLERLRSALFPASFALKPAKVKRHLYLWCACSQDALEVSSVDRPELLKYREDLAAKLGKAKDGILDKLENVEQELEEESNTVSDHLQALSRHLSDLQAALGVQSKPGSASLELDCVWNERRASSI